MTKCLALCVFLLTLGVGPIQAQVTTGTISGTVRDTTGAVIPDARVTVQNTDTGASRTVESDTAGRYSAPSLGLGNYRVTVHKEGFQEEVRSGIVLTVGREAVVNFQLTVGAVTQSVEVTGEAPLLEGTTANLGALVDSRTMRELPLNGRSYDQLALLQPGVAALGGGAGNAFDYGSGKRFTVSGSRSYANSFLLDGADINDHANATPGGAAGTNLGVDAIREFKIMTNAVSAEYGRSTGAVISAVTSSGTNSIHGSAFEFLRNNKLDARNFFDPGPVPPFRRNQFGATVGGPIRKDKIFFFGAYEGLRQGLGTTYINFVPTVDAKQGRLPSATVTVNPAVKPFLALYPNPNGPEVGGGVGEFLHSPTVSASENYFMTRVDYQLTDKTSIFGRYSFDNDAISNPTNQVVGGNLPGFNTRNSSRRQYSTLQMSKVFSPTLLNNVLFAYNRSFPSNDVQPSTPLGPELSFSPGLPMGLIQVGGSSGFVVLQNPLSNLGTSPFSPRSWSYNLFQWQDDVTYIKGRNSLKFGFRFERIRDNVAENSSLRGVYSFTDLTALLEGRASSFQSVPPGQNAYRGIRQSLYAVFGQDDFRLNSRVTLNLGVRWEAVSDPTAVNGLVSNIFSPTDSQFHILDHYLEVSKKNIEPRLGVAWQLNSKGTSVLRSGFGIFHDQILPQVYAINVAKLPPFYSVLTAQNPSFPDGSRQLRQTGAVTILTDDFTLQSPTKIRYNVSFQQQLWGKNALELAYIGSESYHVVGYRAVNLTQSVVRNGQRFFPAGAPRINPNFGAITSYGTDAIANYNGFQAVLKRSSGGLQYEISYTFSKAIDLLSSIATGDTQREPQVYINPQDLRRNRGRASFDVRHSLLLNGTYLLPFKTGQRTLDGIFAGWEVSALGTFQAGQPFTARVGFNRSNSGDNQNPDRPNLVPGHSNNPRLGSPNKYFDANAFSLPDPGTFGNLGRNTLIGPGISSLDLSLQKNFVLMEPLHAQFRAEFFNIANHANFGLPAAQVLFTASGARNAAAGKILDTATSSRQIQFGLKFRF